MTGLRPFFGYYGGKWRTAPKYPAPTELHIVEPFAGSAGYATRYPHHGVTLIDANPVICGIWDYLIHVRSAEVARLPLHFDHVDELAIPLEARDLIGFWLNRGVAAPRRSPSAWMRSGVRPGSFWGEQIRGRIAGQVEAIRHWRVIHADYRAIGIDLRATWFVDPPYEGDQGSHYPHKVTDYGHLGEWCQRLIGQTIVCERDGADWLPFEPLHHAKAMHGGKRSGVSAEAIWTRTDRELFPILAGTAVTLSGREVAQ